MLHFPGFLVPLAVLPPTALWAVFPPRIPPPAEPPGRLTVLAGLENLGRAGVFALPLFYRFNVAGLTGQTLLAGMVLALLIYYAGWLRYFRRGRDYALLFAPLWGIPIPMAVAPVLFFLCAALLRSAWPLLLATLFLAAGHLPITYHEYQRTLGTK